MGGSVANDGHRNVAALDLDSSKLCDRPLGGAAGNWQGWAHAPVTKLLVTAGKPSTQQASLKIVTIAPITGGLPNILRNLMLSVFAHSMVL